MSAKPETATAQVQMGQRARESLQLLTSWSQRNGLFYAYLALLIFFSASSSRFLTTSNIRVILLQSAVFGMIAVPGSMLILSGYVDLSVGSVACFASIIFGELIKSAGIVWWAAFVLTLILGTLWGVLQGYLIAYL